MRAAAAKARVRALAERFFSDAARTHPWPSPCAQAFDYSLVRPAGEPIRGFGGTASGPGPLREMHEACRATLERNVGRPLSITTIVDLMNLVGKCVIAGNVRRTAEIAFGDPQCDEYIDLKNYDKNPERMEHGWTSNNSVFATLGMDYSHLVSRIASNGEPGFAWLDNMRGYGRMNGTTDTSDWRAKGGNPCLEQTLESYELCCLVETFPNRHDSLADFELTLRAAFLYAKTVTLGETHWPHSNRVMLRNRRIGTSISGVAQFISACAAARPRAPLERRATRGRRALTRARLPPTPPPTPPPKNTHTHTHTHYQNPPHAPRARAVARSASCASGASVGTRRCATRTRN